MINLLIFTSGFVWGIIFMVIISNIMGDSDNDFD